MLYELSINDCILLWSSLINLFIPILKKHLCQNFPDSKLFNHLQTSSEIFKHLQKSSNIFRNLQKSSEIFKHLQKSSKIFKNLQKSSEIFKHLQKSSKIFKNLQKSSEIFKNLHQLPKKLGMLVGSRASTDFAPSLVTSRKSSSRASRAQLRWKNWIWKTYP